LAGNRRKALSLDSIMNSVKNGDASAAGGLDFTSVADFLGAE